MRVLIFKRRCGAGGIQSWVCSLTRQLRALGVVCDLWFFEEGTRARDFKAMEGVRWGPPSELVQALARREYDVVHVANNEPFRDLLECVRPLPRVVASAHGELGDPWRYPACVAYTAVSRGVAAMNQPLVDLDIDIVPNGVDVDRFVPPSSPAPGAPIVAWVGRTAVFRLKDFPRFVRIASLLSGRGLRFWVADESNNSPKDYPELGCDRVAIERWERMPYDEMPSFYREVAASGGVLLLTSRSEGWGMVATEVAACGGGALGPDIDGLRDAIVPGVTGALYPPAAPDETVAEEVLRWVESRRGNSNVMATCAEAARREFSAENMARRYLAIYTRTEPRRRNVPLPPWDASDPRVALLLEHAATRPWARPLALREGIRELARNGPLTATWRALRRSLRLEPTFYLKPDGVRFLANLGATALLRPVQGLRPRLRTAFLSALRSAERPPMRRTKD